MKSVFVGVFLLAASVGAQSRELALELMADGQWKAAYAEASRTLLFATNDAALRLMRASAGQKLGLDSTAAFQRIADDPLAPSPTALLARYEWGRLLWKEGKLADAFAAFRTVFERADSPDLFARAGCSLSLMLEKESELASSAPGLPAAVATLQAGLTEQLRTASRLWTKDIRKECSIETATDSGAVTGLPARWVILFYQQQIGPAIGTRCSLSPSCSHYAALAFRRHGWLGVPMTADRLIREPDVVKRQDHLVRKGSKALVADPLEDHDFWMRPEK